jgi:hypothetical protein
MHTVLILLAVGLTLAGPLFFYLSLPHQQVAAQAWPARPCKLAGWALLIAAWGLWSSLYHPLTGFFIALSFAMLTAMALPFVVALGKPYAKHVTAPFRMIAQGTRWLFTWNAEWKPFQACENACLRLWQQADQQLRLNLRWRWMMRQSRAQRATIKAALSWPWRSLKGLIQHVVQTYYIDQRATALERRLRLGTPPAPVAEDTPPAAPLTPQEQP